MPHDNLVPFVRRLLTEAGQGAGSVEVVGTPLPKAVDYAERVCQRHDKTLDEVIPKFESNFVRTQNLAKLGHTKRKDMPVIDEPDVKELQRRLKAGSLDVRKPYAPETNDSNPFPQGLSGDQAKQFVNRGFRDKNLKDDRVDIRMVKISPSDMKPIQKQIYLDKVIPDVLKFGVDDSMNFLRNSVTIISSDNRILDGHHRWLKAMLLDPDMKMNGMQIDLPINILLDLLLSYGDAIGNQRNL